MTDFEKMDNNTIICIEMKRVVGFGCIKLLDIVLML